MTWEGGGGGELSPGGVKSILLYSKVSFLLQTFFYRYFNSSMIVFTGISIPTQGLHM